MNEKTAEIQRLNDEFRRSGSRHGTVLVTSGIQNLGKVNVADILLKAASFDAFDADNDPYHEHDFGSFEHGTDKIFWKIDYYDHSMQFGSPDPSDPSVTARVLTVMLAEEY